VPGSSPARTMLTTCSWVKGFAGLPAMPGLVPPGIVAPSWKAAYRSGGFTPPWRGKLAATSARADLKVGATIFCCAQADKAKTNAIASMREVSVLRNPMATSRAVRGLREVQILLQTRGIGTFTTDSVVVQFYVEAALRRHVARQTRRYDLKVREAPWTAAARRHL
jgi:hypothetical protein